MTRAVGRLPFTAVVLVLATAALAPTVLGDTAVGPFYFTPAPTKECVGLVSCTARVGPWVVVPQGGEATFMIGCPTFYGFLVGGTDARASSSDVRVWFDGHLGAPIGRTGSQGAILLFHAVTTSGRIGSFQPILGCIALKQKNKVSTVSLVRTAGVPGVEPGTPVVLRARLYSVKPFAPLQRAFFAAHCGKGETFVGSWDALTFETAGPPPVSLIRSISVTKIVVDGKVHVVIHRTRPTHLPPATEVQYGAMCEP